MSPEIKKIVVYFGGVFLVLYWEYHEAVGVWNDHVSLKKGYNMLHKCQIAEQGSPQPCGIWVGNYHKKNIEED